MEALYAAVGGLTAFLAALVVSRGGTRRAPSGWLVSRMRRRALALLGRLSRLGLVAWLDVLPGWHALGAEVASAWEEADGDRGPGSAAGPTQGIAAMIAADAGLAVVLCVVSQSPLGFVVAVAVLAVGVPLWDSARLRREARLLSEEMPAIFRTLSMAVGSGETLTQAIEYLGAHVRGPAARPFARASSRLRCGDSAEEALGALTEELRAPGIGLLTTALLISQRTGSPLVTLFRHAARLVERQGEFERMLEVKTAQVRLSVRIVCALPVVMIAALSMLSPDFRAGLATVPGIVSVTLAVAMDAAALLIIRRLMRGVV